jgi:head-tail adaptor
VGEVGDGMGVGSAAVFMAAQAHASWRTVAHAWARVRRCTWAAARMSVRRRGLDCSACEGKSKQRERVCVGGEVKRRVQVPFRKSANVRRPL